MLKKYLTCFFIFFSVGILFFSNKSYSQIQEEVLFQEDFEDGTPDGWIVRDEQDNLIIIEEDSPWSIIKEGDNYILRGSRHTCASPNVQGWMNYSIEAKIKLIAGGFHFNVRTSWGDKRYFIGINDEGFYLLKQIGENVIFDLAFLSESLSLYWWYTVKIALDGANIKVYLNDDLKIDYTDSENPLLFGRFSFETLDDYSEVYFDDILVIGERFHQATKWTKCGGPPGGLGYDVRIHPYDKNIMFVTDNPSGINKSYDGGKTWVARNEGILNRAGWSGDGIPNFSLTFDPSNPDVVWAGMQYARGIYKSIDGGETWVKKHNGITEWNELTVRNFGIDPNNSDIVFAGCEISTGIVGKWFERTRGKIYKTEDGGETWRCVWEGDSLVRFVIVNPTNSDIVYASTGIFDREGIEEFGIGILKSTDRGETWYQINNGITDHLFIGFLEMHPDNPNIIFAAVGNDAMSTYYRKDGGIYRTTNGGKSWEKVLSNDNFTVVTISPSNPNIVYAGSESAFYRSEDAGNIWQMFNKPEEGCYGPPGVRPGIPISAVVDPTNPMKIFVNNYTGGVFKSADGAQTWVDCSIGYTGADINNIAINPDNPTNIYVVANSGTFRSQDGGENWTGLAFNPLRGEIEAAVALNPSNNQEVIVSGGFNGTIYKSTNGGNSWKIVFKHPGVDPGNPMDNQCFQTITYAPSNSSILYAGMRKDKSAVDQGRAESSFGVYKSSDGGETWVEKNSGLENTSKNINDVVIHPSNLDIAYLGSLHDGIFKTTNGGESWGQKNNGLGEIKDVRSLAIDPNNPNIIFAGAWQGGIFKSKDGGENWRPCGIGMSPEASVLSIVIDPSNSQTIYAGDLFSGVYISFDGGETWYPINDDLSTRAVTCMAISADGELLYAGTSGEGVFRIGLLPTYYLTIASTSGGTISPLPGTYAYSPGIQATITALPKTSYRFSYWSGDVSSSANPISLIMDSDKSITANFIRQYTLTIASSSGGTTDPSPGSYTYDSGTEVAITATPESGYEFSGWSDDASGTDNPITITTDSDKSLTANFSAIPSEEETGKKGGCFIATAAYGSLLHPYVRILRDFRDTCLMSSKFGRELVNLYYKYSPYVADFIAKHKALKVAVRISLLPLVVFSYSILHFGPIITAVILVFIFALPIFLISFFRRKLSRVRAKVLASR